MLLTANLDLLLDLDHVPTVDDELGNIPVLIMADLNDNWKRFISDHDVVNRGSDLCKVNVLMMMLVHLHLGNRHAVLSAWSFSCQDLRIAVRVAHTGATLCLIPH